MLQYLIVLLDDASVSFCHYANQNKTSKRMPLDVLRAGVLFAMKENLNVQFAYPVGELPLGYGEVIETIDHCKIKPAASAENADVIVFNSWEEAHGFSFSANAVCVLRTSKKDFFAHYVEISVLLQRLSRLNLVFTDLDTFSDDDFSRYETVLGELVDTVGELYAGGRMPQFNLLTDRMMLDGMNNCGAGDTCVALAPDGRFYICPAFYSDDGGFSSGDLRGGLDIKNAQLFRLDHAPLCRNCDAYQCRRCVWLNRKTTLEVNTPSHEQCVVAHIERNASRKLLVLLKEKGVELAGQFKEIKEIDYLDPFDVRKEW